MWVGNGLLQPLIDPLSCLIANGPKGADDSSAYATQYRQGLFHPVMHIQKWLRLKHRDKPVEAIIYLARFL
jgi:hypothetical protein